MIAIIAVIYVIIAMALVRPMAGHFAWHFLSVQKSEYHYSYKDKIKPDTDQWVRGIFTALILASIWPTVILWRLSGSFLPTIGSEKQAQLEAEIEARKKRDKELGLEEYDYGRVF